MFKPFRSKAVLVSLVFIFSLATGWIFSNEINLKADLLTPTNSALPFMCSSVSTASSSNAAVNSPGNLNYGISLFYGVGSVTPYSGLGPIGNELATISDSNVFEQRYVSTTPAVFAIGAADAIGEQILTVTCDTGTINVSTPALSPVATNMRFYVAKDGSTYHSRADHHYSTWPNGPDLTPQQALVPQHLAKASPTYQSDCYNTAQVTYGAWSCQNTTTKTRNKTVTGKSYNSTTQSCDTDATPQVIAETEMCASGNVCSSGGCVPAVYTVDDDFNASTAHYGVLNFNSIQTAVDTVPENSTVLINAGLYNGNVRITRNVNLKGTAASQVILDGGGANSVLTIKNAGGTYADLTIRNSAQNTTSPGNVGVHIDPVPAHGGTFTIKDSVIYGNGEGIALWNGLNAQVTLQNNMIFRNLYNGIRNDGFGQTTITNNTISDNGKDGYADVVGKGPHVVKNNIIVKNGRYGFLSHVDSKPRTMSYNNLWSNRDGNYAEFSSSYAAFVPLPGTGELSLDPQFTNRSVADYSLKSTSPLKLKGENNVDMGSTVTIGATNLSALVIADAPTTEPGLIGHWKFDGNGNNEVAGRPPAVIVGNASFKSDGGKLGGYAYIPAKTDWVKIPFDSVYDLPTSFTIEFWFRQRSNQSFLQDLVYKGNPVNNYNFRILRQLWNVYNFGPIITGYTSSSTSYWTQTSNPNQLTHNEWHHVVYTKDAAQSAYYLDGTRTHFSEQTDSAVTPAADIIIGDSAVDTDIDNLRIYNRNMLQDEVRLKGGFPAQSTSTSSSTTPSSSSSNTSLLTTGTSTSTPSTTTTGLLTTGSTATTVSSSDSFLTTGSYASTVDSGLLATGASAGAAITTNVYSAPSYTPSTGISNVYNTSPSGSVPGLYPMTSSGSGLLTTGTSATIAPYSANSNMTGFYPNAPENYLFMSGAYAGSTTSSAIQTDPLVFVPSEVTISPVLLRSLEAAEKTLDDFEMLLQDLRVQGKSTDSLVYAQDLLEDGRYYARRIHDALELGDKKFANRRFGMLNQVIQDVQFEWEHLARGFEEDGLQILLPTFAESYNTQALVKEELKNYAVDEIADKITKLIIGKIDYTEILNHVVQQFQNNKDVVDRLFQYTAKHEAEVSKTMDVLVTVNESFHEDYLESKVDVLEKVDGLDEAVGQLSLQKEAIGQLDALKEKILGYNFVGPIAEQMVAQLAAFSAQLGLNEGQPESVEAEIDSFSQEIEQAIQASSIYKFDQGYIPFRDTDDQHWFTQYVGPIKEQGIISGYKDAQGNSLGSFGPGNDMTVAEILKIALEASGSGQGDAAKAPVLLQNHWAAGYVTMAQEKGLTLMKKVEITQDLDRPVTRAEVVRVLIEAFGISVGSTAGSSFEDAEGHVDELFVSQARALDIVSGYSDGTFRPDNPVNRAEVAKIVNLALSNF